MRGGGDERDLRGVRVERDLCGGGDERDLRGFRDERDLRGGSDERDLRSVSGERDSRGGGFVRVMRLTDGAQFKAVFERRRRAHDAHFSAHVAPNLLGHARIGLAVSRRVSKKAVERNRLKRLMRESFRRRFAELGAVDYVVVAKIGAAAQPNPALRDELQRLWGKARRAVRGAARAA